MIRLFLDDMRVPADCIKINYIISRGYSLKHYYEDWIIVRSYGEFIEYINKNKLPDIISFDHDLGDVFELKENLDLSYWFNIDENREYTGYDCAKWLVDYCIENKLQLPEYIIHSANPVGYENIKNYLENFKKYY